MALAHHSGLCCSPCATCRHTCRKQGAEKTTWAMLIKDVENRKRRTEGIFKLTQLVASYEVTKHSWVRPEDVSSIPSFIWLGNFWHLFTGYNLLLYPHLSWRSTALNWEQEHDATMMMQETEQRVFKPTQVATAEKPKQAAVSFP